MNAHEIALKEYDNQMVHFYVNSLEDKVKIIKEQLLNIIPGLYEFHLNKEILTQQVDSFKIKKNKLYITSQEVNLSLDINTLTDIKALYTK